MTFYLKVILLRRKNFYALYPKNPIDISNSAEALKRWHLIERIVKTIERGNTVNPSDINAERTLKRFIERQNFRRITARYE